MREKHLRNSANDKLLNVNIVLSQLKSVCSILGSQYIKNLTGKHELTFIEGRIW